MGAGSSATDKDGGRQRSDSLYMPVDINRDTIFSFKVKSATGDIIALSTYKKEEIGAYLIVSVGKHNCHCPKKHKCHPAERHYRELQDLYNKYHISKGPDISGLEILAFPCNNFSSLEPERNKDLQSYIKSKEVTFPVLGKIHCQNGSKTSSLYTYLRSALTHGHKQELKGNFTKYLCDKDGRVVRFYLSSQNPSSFEQDIQNLLSTKNSSNLDDIEVSTQ